MFFLWFKKQAKILDLLTSTHYGIGRPSHCYKASKRDKSRVNEKEKQNAVTRDSIPMYIAILCNPQKIF